MAGKRIRSLTTATSLPAGTPYVAVDGSDAGVTEAVKMAASVFVDKSLPSQSTHSGKVLGTNGTTVSWVSAGTGTVASVGVSVPSILTVSGTPVTTSGTIAIGLADQTANRFLAAPNGSDGAPTFRAIVAADLPTVSIAKGGTGQTTAVAALNALLPGQPGNSGKVLVTDGTNANWQSITGSGTVTSVELSMPSLFTVTGSPITSSGTLAVALASQSANLVFASPSGGSGSPAFRGLVVADLPTVSTAKGGTGLTSIGSANRVLGVNNAANALEYKTITAGTNVTVTHGANSITIAASGGGGGGLTVVDEGNSTRSTTSSDNDKLIRLINMIGGCAITLHANASAGEKIEFCHYAFGDVSFSAASGATVENVDSQYKIKGLYGRVTAICIENLGGSNARWNLSGSTKA